MRIGINVPTRNAAAQPLTAAELQQRAQMIEDAGFDGIWMGDSVNSTITRPDVLTWLAVAAAATTHVEVGTSVFVLPLRHSVDVAQRMLTLEALTPGRVSIGVGAGSGRFGAEVVGLEFEDRFRVLRESLEALKRYRDVDPGPRAAGSSEFATPVPRWPPLATGPRLLIGSWHSEIWLRRAAQQYDGWLCSAGRTNYSTMSEAIKRYRDLGGVRAIVSTCATDLHTTRMARTDDDSFNLFCGEEEARERLGRLSELGFDDVLLVHQHHDAQPRPGIYEADFTGDELEEIRSLAPRAS